MRRSYTVLECVEYQDKQIYVPDFPSRPYHLGLLNIHDDPTALLFRLMEMTKREPCRQQTSPRLFSHFSRMTMYRMQGVI